MITSLKFYFTCYPHHDVVKHERLKPQEFEKLCRAFPACKRSDQARWEMMIREDDPLLKEVLEFLKSIGKSPYIRRVPHVWETNEPGKFSIEKQYDFSEQDLSCAPFLRMDGSEQTGEHKHLHFESPVLVRIRPKIPPIGWADGEAGPIGTQSVKEAMEAEDFMGFIFTPVAVEGRRQPPEPLWEIWSNRVMPPMCCPLVDDDGNPVRSDDYSKGCFTADNQMPDVYEYTSKSLATMAGVDAAVTHEDFGPKTKLCEMRRLLVSQRFRQWALKKKIKLDYVPVLVKEDIKT